MGEKVLDTAIKYDKNYMWYIKANDWGNVSVWKVLAKRGRPKKKE
jgi:hypothetical protein